jgi:hypothetical protein
VFVVWVRYCYDAFVEGVYGTQTLAEAAAVRLRRQLRDTSAYADVVTEELPLDCSGARPAAERRGPGRRPVGRMDRLHFR